MTATAIERARSVSALRPAEAGQDRARQLQHQRRVDGVSECRNASTSKRASVLSRSAVTVAVAWRPLDQPDLADDLAAGDLADSRRRRSAAEPPADDAGSRRPTASPSSNSYVAGARGGRHSLDVDDLGRHRPVDIASSSATSAIARWRSMRAWRRRRSPPAPARPRPASAGSARRRAGGRRRLERAHRRRPRAAGERGDLADRGARPDACDAGQRRAPEDLERRSTTSNDSSSVVAFAHEDLAGGELALTASLPAARCVAARSPIPTLRRPPSARRRPARSPSTPSRAP